MFCEKKDQQKEIIVQFLEDTLPSHPLSFKRQKWKEREGEERFSQTETSPPVDPALTEEFGFCAEKAAAKAVLEGTHDLSSIENPYVRKFLEYVRQPNRIVNNGGQIGTSYWTKQEGQTTSETFVLLPFMPIPATIVWFILLLIITLVIFQNLSDQELKDYLQQQQLTI